MLVDPHIADAQPLIVVGPPRCGTRFVTTTLNRHPEIHLNAEITIRAMDTAIRYLQESTAIYERFASGRIGKPHWADGWQQGRHTILYAMWSTLAKIPGKRPSRPVRWYGYKTPYHERYWRFYRDFLGQLRPKFVFCVRGFAEHYMSCEAMNPHPISRRATMYRESLNHYADMKAELGSDVSLFILDELKEGGVNYLRTVLFNNLSIPVHERTLAKLAPERPANTSASMGRNKRELTKDERGFLARNPDLTDALAAVRAAKPISPENS